MDTGPDNYAEIIFEHTHITSISDGIKFHPTCYTTEVKWVSKKKCVFTVKSI